MDNKKLALKVTIVLGGDDEHDLDTAMNEAVKKIDEGYITGHDSNESGSYYFNVTPDVPEHELSL